MTKSLRYWEQNWLASFNEVPNILDKYTSICMFFCRNKTCPTSKIIFLIMWACQDSNLGPLNYLRTPTKRSLAPFGARGWARTTEPSAYKADALTN